MKRYQVVLCAIAAVATVAALFFAGWWFYKAITAVALFCVTAALVALSF
ncbi:hypothetical protein [Rubneribacter sp.]